MSEQAPAAGWYPDPERAGVSRYWDGSAWTEHRQADPASAARAAGGHDYADWGRRFGAYLIDGFLTILVPVALGFLAYGLAGDDDVGFGVGGLSWVVMVLFYAPTMLATGGQTLGKRATRIRVVLATGEPIGFGRAFARETLIKYILFGLLTLPLLIDGLFPLWDEEKRALHDMMVETRVVAA